MLKNLVTKARTLVQDTSGVTAIEYGMIAAVMAGVIVAALAVIDLNAMFSSINSAMTAALP